jgi:arylamine N-acetyltransferase
MLESVNAEEAARLLKAHLGRRAGGLGGARGVGGAKDLGNARGVEFLRQLAYHFAEFPYENISKIIKTAGAPTLAEALRLPTEVVTDHIDRNFGGTCFSLTFLFERMLKSFGFDCYKVMADMNSGRNVHCLVVVREGGAKYIVDPGYALYEVIPLPAGASAVERARLPHATVEVSAADGAGSTAEKPGAAHAAFNLWTEDATGRKWRYRFADRPTPDAEFETHWLESFAKPTLHNICLTRMTPRGHIYFRKDFFKFTSPTAVEKRRLAGGRERLIEQEFGIGGKWVELAQQVLDAQRRAVFERRAEAAAVPPAGGS